MRQEKGKSAWWCWLGLLMLAVIGHGWAAADEFTVIALPDTQNYSDEYPGQFTAQTQWIVNNQASLDIRFVTHLGDVVDNAPDIRQWENAAYSMSFLDAANIPYGIAYGNHDIRYGDPDYDPDATNYRYYFGPQHYAGKSWYKGHSPSEMSNYQVIDMGQGRELLFLHLCVETPPAELSWAQEVLNANRDKPVFVSTHRYMQDAEDYVGGVPIVPSGRFPNIWYSVAEPLYRHDGIQANVFFEGFVKPNRNIFLVHCGHFHEEYRQISYNNAGLPVHEILADYQDDPQGGDGWLRIMTFKPDQNKIEVDSYSPTLGSYRTANESMFDLNVVFDDYTYDATSPAIRFQNGVGGYYGTQDTWIGEKDPDSSHNGESIVIVDDDTENHWWNEYEGQGLFRFDDIFQMPVYEGDPAPTRIPTNATISKADMSINVIDDIDDPRGCDFYVYKLERAWNEYSTWNSLGGGMRDDISTHLATFDGDNDPDGNTVRTFSILSAVNAWKGGQPNYGVGIFTEYVDFQDDGIEIASSENGSWSLRPALDVEFSYTVINVAPSVVGLTASAVTLYEGETLAMTMSASDPNPNDPLIFRINAEDVGFATGSGEITIEYVIDDEGVYTFDGEVSDDEATVPATSQTVTVLNAPPVIATLTEDFAVIATVPFDLSVTASDPGLYDMLSYHWDMDGDGQFDDATGAEVSWSFAQVGPHVVTVQVRDNDGGVTEDSVTVTVLQRTPGDADLDGDVDPTDLTTLSQHWLQDSGVAWPQADFNENGRVGLTDFAMLSTHYGIGM